MTKRYLNTRENTLPTQFPPIVHKPPYSPPKNKKAKKSPIASPKPPHTRVLPSTSLSTLPLEKSEKFTQKAPIFHRSRFPLSLSRSSRGLVTGSYIYTSISVSHPTCNCPRQLCKNGGSSCAHLWHYTEEKGDDASSRRRVDGDEVERYCVYACRLERGPRLADIRSGSLLARLMACPMLPLLCYVGKIFRVAVV